jgi:hypothetical protein
MEEHIIWDCKWYKDQQATMMDIWSENSKMNTWSKLLRLEVKKIVQGVCYFIDKIPKFI